MMLKSILGETLFEIHYYRIRRGFCSASYEIEMKFFKTNSAIILLLMKQRRERSERLRKAGKAHRFPG